jgi:hypothetical protein
VDLESFDTKTIELPHLHNLAIQSGTMGSWAVTFLQNVEMPVLRILTMCVTTENPCSVEGLIDELVNLTDSEDSEDPLELDELHLINFVLDRIDADLLHRLYTQMPTVETLTLGLLPTRGGLSGLPLSGLWTLVVFDIPKQLIWRIVLERQSLAGPLEELYCRYNEANAADDWQHQVKKYHRIDSLKSARYTDVIARQWSYLEP